LSDLLAQQSFDLVVGGFKAVTILSHEKILHHSAHESSIPLQSNNGLGDADG